MDARIVPAGPQVSAFSIEECELALRWAAAMDPSRFRLVITPERAQADEVIEVHLGGQSSVAFTLARRSDRVLLTDCLGMSMVFATLADALSAISPSGSLDRRAVLRTPRPACLQSIDPRFVSVQRRRGWLARALRRALRWMFCMTALCVASSQVAAAEVEVCLSRPGDQAIEAEFAGRVSAMPRPRPAGAARTTRSAGVAHTPARGR